MQHIHHGEVSLQLRLMAQLGQLSIIAIVFVFVHGECYVPRATSDEKGEKNGQTRRNTDLKQAPNGMT